jgi:hypothetical protein
MNCLVQHISWVMRGYFLKLARMFSLFVEGNLVDWNAWNASMVDMHQLCLDSCISCDQSIDCSVTRAACCRPVCASDLIFHEAADCYCILRVWHGSLVSFFTDATCTLVSSGVEVAQQNLRPFTVGFFQCNIIEKMLMCYTIFIDEKEWILTKTLATPIICIHEIKIIKLKNNT